MKRPRVSCVGASAFPALCTPGAARGVGRGEGTREGGWLWSVAAWHPPAGLGGCGSGFAAEGSAGGDRVAQGRSETSSECSCACMLAWEHGAGKGRVLG